MAKKWRPIETAPKNGTPILVYMPEPLSAAYRMDGDEGWSLNIFMARWATPNYLEGDHWITPHTESDIFSGSEYTGSWTETENIRVYPTHWMPLPEPPSAS